MSFFKRLLPLKARMTLSLQQTAVEQGGPFKVFDLWSPRRGGRAIGQYTASLRLRLRPHSVRLLRMELAARPDAPPKSA